MTEVEFKQLLDAAEKSPKQIAAAVSGLARSVTAMPTETASPPGKPPSVTSTRVPLLASMCSSRAAG